MKTQLTLTVTPRTQTGRSASRRVRKANAIPAILYGKHTSPEKLSVDTPEFVRLLKVVSGRAVLIQLQQAGKAEKALSFLQEIQRDPITDKYLHLDLQEVKANELFEIRVPVVTAGESFGVKNQSGVLEMNAHLLRVRCLPPCSTLPSRTSMMGLMASADASRALAPPMRPPAWTIPNWWRNGRACAQRSFAYWQPNGRANWRGNCAPATSA
jgi:ribosomal protein bL25 (Ctc-form)